MVGGPKAFDPLVAVPFVEEPSPRDNKSSRADCFEAVAGDPAKRSNIC